MKTLKPKFEDALKSEQNLAEELAKKERAINILYSKQGRRHQFRSREERDRWISEQLEQQESTLKKNKEQISKMTREIEGLESELKDVQTNRANKSKNVEEKKKLIETHQSEFNKKKIERDEKMNQRK